MDPWLVSSASVDSRSFVNDVKTSLISTSVRNSKGLETFEDNFIPEGSDPSQFQKLPDSEVYLKSLEKKLQKLQSSVVSNREKSKEILRSLEESRESCMLNLLSGNSPQVSEFEDLKVNPLLKKIQPEKQALSAEELILLVKADQLQNIVADEGEDSKCPDSTQEGPEQ